MTKPHITKMYIREYTDNGQITCYIDWSDGSRTEGSEHSEFMQALVVRGIRAGVPLDAEVW